MALWESLNDADREVELTLSAEQESELGKPIAEHVADPTSAIRWEDMRRKLTASR